MSPVSDAGGRSLTMVFSDGIGLEFDVFYAISMVAAPRFYLRAVTAAGLLQRCPGAFGSLSVVEGL